MAEAFITRRGGECINGTTVLCMAIMSSNNVGYVGDISLPDTINKSQIKLVTLSYKDTSSVILHTAILDSDGVSVHQSYVDRNYSSTPAKITNNSNKDIVTINDNNIGVTLNNSHGDFVTITIIY